MRYPWLLAPLALIGTLAGCTTSGSDEPNQTPPPGELLQSAKVRITSPAVPAGDLAELVAGNNAFAFDFYQQIRADSENIIFSPYSISLALALTYAGARNVTQQEMADTLDFTLPEARLDPAFDALDLALALRATTASGKDAFKLNIVNRIWGQSGFSFDPAFLDVLAEYYGAGLSLLDFATAAETARIEINDWVAVQTVDRIKDLIPEGAITASTRLVLTNAIYFKASWSSQFEPAATHDAPFHLLDGSQISVRIMRQTEAFGYAAGDGYQSVELPYVGGVLSMVVFLPDTGRFDEFEAGLSGTRVASLLGELQGQEIDLSLPRFTFSWNASLRDVLSVLGMPAAFDPSQADFSGMTTQAQLFIQDVIHKAFIAVDEEGTEAAAATAVIVGVTAAPASPLQLVVDRPFLFVIRDSATGAILFVGRVVNPGS